MIQRPFTDISIIIPVYNEGPALADCLLSIAAQSLRPREVIVVDNNSTDDSATIASSFDFVTLIHEPKQGVVHARSTGFDAAKAGIIARIDADSVLPADWLEQITEVFNDPTVDATSGVAHYYNVAAAPMFDAIDIFFRRRLSWQLGDRMYLWGANMAMRRTAWRQVRESLCHRGNLHEDYDIAIHLQELGGKVTFDERMQAAVSSRRIDVSYRDFMRYVWVSPDTYAQHGIRQRWHMYWIVLVCGLGYMPARILHRGYDPRLQRFSWSYLINEQPVAARVDPTANVA